MNPRRILLHALLTLITVSGIGALQAANCARCHLPNVNAWAYTAHANSQTNVAYGLATSHVGQTATEALYGPGGQNCIACHGPTSVLTNGGMTEVQSMEHYFTMTSGQFSASTSSTNRQSWPNVECNTCHYVPPDHLYSPSFLALFDSTAKQYAFMPSAHVLCGQCHGMLRHTNSTQKTFEAWLGSGHRNSQESLAAAFRTKYAGKTPQQVLDSENCVACHAPITPNWSGEAGALYNFFTTTDGVFTSSTVSAQTNNWPGVDCTACHEPHSAGVAYYNSTTQSYEAVDSAEKLCGKCHGTLRFADSRYRSYDVNKQIGGIGVTNVQVMVGVTCLDCHMHSEAKADSLTKQFHGHSWAITIQEPNGTTVTSCTRCHPSISTFVADAIIGAWKTEFLVNLRVAQTNVARAFATYGGSPDAGIQAALSEAKTNLELAMADESGGAHNPTYMLALVRAASDRVSGLIPPPSPTLSAALLGNNVIINWSGGVLQQSGEPVGEWEDVTNAASPLLLPPANQAPRQFFRLRQ